MFLSLRYCQFKSVPFFVPIISSPPGIRKEWAGQRLDFRSCRDRLVVKLTNGEGGMIMGTVFEWETDIAKALARAAAQHRSVLLDFFNPG